MVISGQPGVVDCIQEPSYRRAKKTKRSKMSTINGGHVCCSQRNKRNEKEKEEKKQGRVKGGGVRGGWTSSKKCLRNRRKRGLSLQQQKMNLGGKKRGE